MGDRSPSRRELCNVIDRPILLDIRAGYWFVEVEDVGGQQVPHTRAVDVLRVGRPDPEWLAPSLCWRMKLETLSLVVGLPPSTPLWEYQALEAGEYFLRAEFRTWPPVTSVLQWQGKAVSGRARAFVR